MHPLLKDAWAKWNRYWFDEDESYLPNVALFRLCFGAVLGYYYMSRQQDVGFLYTDSGILPWNYVKTSEVFINHWSVLAFTNDLFTLQCLHLLLIACCFSLSLGFFTRLSAFGAYFLALNFFNRCPVASFGVDTISPFFFCYFIFSRAGERLSLDAKIWGRQEKPREWAKLLGNISFRLMQIQLCIIYTYSGLEKLRGPSWWDGSAMWKVMTMPNFQRWDLSFMTQMPFILALMAYSAVLWEIYFVVLLGFERLRKYVLLYGVMMHVGIMVFMGLPTFGAMMMSIYFLFIDRKTAAEWCEKIAAFVRPKHSLAKSG